MVDEKDTLESSSDKDTASEQTKPVSIKQAASSRAKRKIEHVPLWKKASAGLVAVALVATVVPLSACSQSSSSSSSDSSAASSSAPPDAQGGNPPSGNPPDQAGSSSSSSSSDSSSSSSSSDSSDSASSSSSNGQQPGGTPPDQPNSSSSSSDSSASSSGGTPPAQPNSSSSSSDSSSSSNGTPPEMPSGDSGNGQQQNGGGAGGGANTQSFDYSGSYSGAVSADGTEQESSNVNVSATDSDQNALLVQNGGTLTVESDTIEKSGDDTNGDNCNFYGVNSAVLAVGSESKAYISKSSITSSSAGSNGIFATDGATVYAYDNRITSTSTDGNARGLDATYDGTIVADRMTISTDGQHSAGVATDRGGGNISLANSTISTSGSGSPLLYSTGDIEVENVTGTATGSQIAGMEGLNSILISNSTLSSTNDAISGSDPIKNGVIIYQSTSGDADTSTGDAANFSVEDSTLSSSISDGSMFYLTNTTANVVLKETKLDFDSSNVALLTVQGNDSNNWGSAGKNGATCNFTLDDEDVSGAITVDDISKANVYLLNGTTWTGSASVTENSASDKSTTKSPLTINVDSDSKWVVTGNSTVSNLNVAKGGKVVDSDGKTVTIKVNGKTVVKGKSSYTVKVTGKYSTKVKTSSVNKVSKASIDRSAFDEYYSTTTTFGENDADDARGTTVEATVSTVSSSSSGDGDDGFFQSIIDAILSLFSSDS